MGPGRRGAEAADMVLLREETASVVLPMRVVFLPTSSVSGNEAFLKGGFCSPILPPTRNFWLDGGINKSFATRSERSEIVASWAKDSVIALPWWVRVISMSELEGGGADVVSASVIVEAL